MKTMSNQIQQFKKPGQNPGTQLASQQATSTTDQNRAMMEVQGAMLIARSNPRDPKAALDRILNSCARPTLAQQALYSYARGGTDITGPSIRLAEAIAQQWGNLQYGIRELEQNNGVSKVEAYAWDLETNVRQSKEFVVEHVRYSRSKGNTRLEDPRDIYETVANQGARRLRACILGVIPGDIIEEAQAQCELTMKAEADVTPEGQKKIIEAFAAHGVKKDQLEARIQRRIDAITPAQVVQLRKILLSLRDGMSSPGDWFQQIKTDARYKAGQFQNKEFDAVEGDEERPAPEPATEPLTAPEPEQKPKPQTESATKESRKKATQPETPPVQDPDETGDEPDNLFGDK